MSQPEQKHRGVPPLTLGAIILLLGALTYGTSEMLHAQLLSWGEGLYPEYHSIRVDPVQPACAAEELRAQYEAAKADFAKQGGLATEGAESDDDLLDALDEGKSGDTDDDLLDVLAGDEDPKPAAEQDDDLLDALEEKTTQTKPAATDDDDDLLGALGEDGDEDLLDELADASPKRTVTAGQVESWRKNLARCEAKHVAFREASGRITDSVKLYRSVETTVAAIVTFGVAHLSHVLALLLLICALTTTLLRHHISLRPIRSRGDDRVSGVAQLICNGMLAHSAYTFGMLEAQSGTSGHAGLYWIWVGGFSAMFLANLYHLVTSNDDLEESGPTVGSLLTIPLYCIMGLISGAYFLIAESHPSGLAIYVGRLAEHAILYIHVGLYVWVGMLLKQTRLATLSFDLVRPWRLAPELLAFVAVVGAALPTAYSGASGIFVIAVGYVIYDELTKAGARPQLALAATAMSGSMGVVLRPCLLVVIVASLNKQVTTDQLFGWGFNVFLLSAVLFLIVALMNRKSELTVAPASEALPEMWEAAKPLLRYVALFVALLVFYHFVLNAHLDEHSAPVMLPLLIIAFLIFDRMTGRSVEAQDNEEEPERSFSLRKAVGDATAETTGHIGALLMLMGLSVALGGIIERADLMAQVPETFGSVWLTMSVLVVVLVIIGMTMDPYGAVILVSATIAAVAYRNGIDPVHFWMVVLVAFELGYLTPPVALNHLLTRQVVGDEAFRQAGMVEGTFWDRNERILLPITVMSIALLIVAFVPLLWS